MDLLNTDVRRAAALILHHNNHDQDGIVAIFEEANANQRGTHMVLGVLGLFEQMVPELRTNLGQKILNDFLLEVASGEAE